MADANLIDKYKSIIAKLLPSGKAWDEVKKHELLRGLAIEFARVEERGKTLLAEIDPNQSQELFEDWLQLLGIPDECTPEGATQEELRQQILQAMSAQGTRSLSAAFYIALAESLGITITVNPCYQFLVGRQRVGDALTNRAYGLFRVGLNRVGDRLRRYGWTFYYRVDVPIAELQRFRVGENRVGDRLVTAGNQLMQCVLKKYRPAHTNIVFTYGG